MNLKYYKLDKNAIEPTYGTSESAGFDLYAINGAILAPKESAIFHTGIAMEIPNGYFGAIYPRSGLAIKHGLRLQNCVGIIDSDYRGEIMVGLYNDSDKCQVISYGDRVAQMVIQPYVHAELDQHDVSELNTNTERSTGGFGSTGRN